jgi:hypothetical protein
VISQFDFLGEVDVEYSVEISDGTETVTLDEIFGVSFFETLNSTPCDPPNPLGSTCDDWFEYEGALEESFVLSGTEYSVRIRGFCDQGTDPDTCVPGRLYTAENEATVGLVYEIKAGGTAAAAPAPGVLVLIGTGLLGLAFARRRAAQG